MRMNKTARVISFILAAAMLLSLTACAGRSEKWAVDVDGEQIPTGVYLYYQFNAYQEASALATDTKTPLLKQTIEEQDASVWIHQKTIEYCTKKVAVEREFARLGMELSETDRTYIESMVSYILTYYGEIFEKNGIGEESVRAACTTDQMTSALFFKYYGKDGLEAVSETELKNYYTENYAIAYMLSAALSGKSDEDVDKVKAAATAAVEGLKAGKGIADTARQLSTVIDGPADTEDTSTDADYLVTVRKDDTGYPEELRTQVFKAAVDVPALYESEDYLIVYVRKDTASQTETFESLKNSILQAIKGDEYSEKLKELQRALTVTENSAAVSYYSVNKIKDLDA